MNNLQERLAIVMVLRVSWMIIEVIELNIEVFDVQN